MLCVCANVHAELLEKIVARVGDEIILYSELESTKIAMQKEVPALKELSEKELNVKVLDQLLNEKLVFNEIKKRGYEPSEKDVMASINSIVKQNGMTSVDDLKYALKQEGIDFNEYKKSISMQLAQGRLMSWMIRPKLKSLSNEEIEKQLRNEQMNEKEKKEANTAELYLLFKARETVSKTQMSALYERINTVEDFIGIAKTETQGPAKDKGGYLGVLNISELKAEIQKEVQSSALGKSNVIDSPEGYYVVYIKDKKYVEQSISTQDIEQRKRMMESKVLAKAFDRFVVDLRRKTTITKY